MKDKMTWEETIQYIRTKPEFTDLVAKAYFEEDLSLNVERFRKSGEFIETIKLLQEFQPNAKIILDIGSGNGISAIAFALEGYDVVTIEPDGSETIGAGAIRKLKEYYKLTNIDIYEAFAEELQLKDESFDIVYTRQCLHHAYDLDKFVGEASRVLKKGGLFISLRDHVIFDEQDKEWFLENHPLQKFYGGENAFTALQYRNAMEQSGLQVIKELKYFDSIVNYFPLSKLDIESSKAAEKDSVIAHLNKRLGWLSRLSFVQNLYLKKIGFDLKDCFNENKIPGRIYSYIAIKQ